MGILGKAILVSSQKSQATFPDLDTISSSSPSHVSSSFPPHNTTHGFPTHIRNMLVLPRSSFTRALSLFLLRATLFQCGWGKRVRRGGTPCLRVRRSKRIWWQLVARSRRGNLRDTGNNCFCFCRRLQAAAGCSARCAASAALDLLWAWLARIMCSIQRYQSTPR